MGTYAACEYTTIGVAQDPIFKGNKVPNPELGYPGGIFDPFGFSKGNFKVLFPSLSWVVRTAHTHCSELADAAQPAHVIICISVEGGPVSSALQPHAVRPRNVACVTYSVLGLSRRRRQRRSRTDGSPWLPLSASSFRHRQPDRCLLPSGFSTIFGLLCPPSHVHASAGHS